jgi:hypothetical protein
LRRETIGSSSSKGSSRARSGVGGAGVVGGGGGGGDRFEGRRRHERADRLGTDADGGAELVVGRGREQEEREAEATGCVLARGDRHGDDLDDFADRADPLTHGVDREPALGPRGRGGEVDAHGATPGARAVEQEARLERRQLSGDRRVEIERERRRGRFERIERVEDGARRRRRLVAIGELLHAVLDRANRFEERVGGAEGEAPPRSVGSAEDGLHPVRDGDRRLDADHRREPLDRMQGAKEIANGARVVSAFADERLDLQELDVAEMELLVDLGDVGREKLFEIDALGHAGPRAGGARRETTSWRIASGENGLVMKRLAPAPSALARDDSSPRVVTMTMGSVRSLSWLRTNSMTSMPPMSGMLRSSTTTSNVPSDSRSMASRPLDAWVTFSDAFGRKHAETMSRMTLLSSTTRTSATCVPDPICR